MYNDKARHELKQFEIEFSKLYKRLMNLETVIKARVKDAVINTCGDNSFEKFHNFFNKEKLYKDYNTASGNPFLALLMDNDLNSADKFVKLVDKLYLRHILQLVLKVPEFRDENIQNIFYHKKPEKFGILLDNRQNIVDLRNDVAHYNFKRYSIKQKEYFEALLIYEIHLGCNLGALNHLPVDLPYKPNMRKILDKICELRPDLFDKTIPHSKYHCNKDRIIVDLYEDIAVLNGWKYNELKSPWDVIRRKYKNNEQKGDKTIKYTKGEPDIKLQLDKSSCDGQLSLLLNV